MAQVKARIQRWGNSMCVRIPSTLLKAWGMAEGQSLALSLQGNALVAKPAVASYKLADLLAQCDFSQPISEQEREWFNAPAVGLEEI